MTPAGRETGPVSEDVPRQSASARYRSLKPYGEPFMSKYGLYDTRGNAGLQGDSTDITAQTARMCVLAWGDGETDVMTIARKSHHLLKALRDQAFTVDAAATLLVEQANILVKAGLVELVIEHRPADCENIGVFCGGCHQPWPCPDAPR